MNIRLILILAAMAASCALLLILPAQAVTPSDPSSGPREASVTPSPWREPGGGAPMQYRGPRRAAADTPTATSTLTPSPTPTPCEDVYEPDDMIPSAIGAGETQNRTFCPSGDVDLVTCLAKAGHAYRVYTSNLSPGTDTELTVTVPGIPDPLYNDDRQPTDLSSFIEFVTPLGPDVTFLIVVASRGPYGPSYSYQLSVQEYVPTPTITPTPDLRDAYEPDEGAPVHIVVGTTQRHNFFPFGDIDYVWFSASAGRLYRASTTGVDTSLIAIPRGLAAPNEEALRSPILNSEVLIQVPVDRDVDLEIRSRGQYGGDQIYDLTVEEITLTPTPTFTPEPTLYGTPCWLPLALRPAPTPTPTMTRTPTQNPYPVPTSTITATPTRTLPPTSFPTFTPTLSPTPQPTPINCYEALRNTSFESDEAWQRGSSPHPAAYTTVVALSGVRAMRLGIEPWSANQESYSSISQPFTIPANAVSATLRYWVWRHTEETPTWAKPWPGSAGLPTSPALATGPAPDVQAVMLWDGANYITLLKTKTNDEIWVQITHDLTPWRGRQLLIYFNANNDGLGGKTWMYLDDVTIQVCLPPGMTE